jgi:O-antigen/teichoic acid export membrane protein
MILKNINLFKQISSQSLIIVINQLSILVALPIIASKVDFYSFGQISIAFTLIQASWIVSDWGMTNYIIEKWSTSKNRNNLCCTLIYSRIVISLLMFLLFFGMIFLNLIDLPNNFELWIFLSIFMGALTPIWFFQLLKVSQLMIFPTIIGRLIFLLTIILFLENNYDAYIALLAQGAGLSVVTITGYYLMKTKYNLSFIKFDYSIIVSQLVRATPFMITSFANNQINFIWVFILSIVGGANSMALYMLGDQIYRAGVSFSNTIAQAIRIDTLNIKFDSTIKILFLFLFVYLLAGTIVFYFIDTIIFIFFPSTFMASLAIIKVLIIACFLNAVIKLYSYTYFGRMYNYNYVNKINLYAVIINFLFVAVWVFLGSSVDVMPIIFLCALITHLVLLFSRPLKESLVKKVD